MKIEKFKCKEIGTMDIIIDAIDCACGELLCLRTEVNDEISIKITNDLHNRIYDIRGILSGIRNRHKIKSGDE